MKDVQLLILTPNGSVAGIGELGEIYVRRCVCVCVCACVVQFTTFFCPC
jgi:hypothetical protein